MSKVTLKNVGSGYNTQANINANNDLIENAFDNTLSRNGQGPNEMLSPLDMNGHRIQNLPNATDPRDPVTLDQAGQIIGLLTTLTSDLVAEFLDPDDLVDILQHCASDRHGNTGYVKKTPAEDRSGVVVVDYHKLPGDAERYGVNTLPGTTDMGPAIAAALRQNQEPDGAPVYTGPGPYVSSVQLSFCPNGEDLKVWYAANTVILFTNDTHGVVIGSTLNGRETSRPKIFGYLEVEKVGGNTTSTKTGIRIEQCFDGDFCIGVLNYGTGYQYAAATAGCAHNRVHLGRVLGCRKGHNIDITGGYVNQNTTLRGRMAGRTSNGEWLVDTVTSGQINNTNRFVGTSFELSASATLIGLVRLGGESHQLKDCRFEGGGNLAGRGSEGDSDYIPANKYLVIDDSARNWNVKDCYGIRSAYIYGRGEGGKLEGVDEVEFTSSGGGSALVPTLSHNQSKPNPDGIPNIRFRELYSGSGTSGGLQVEAKRNAGQILNATLLGDIVSKGSNTKNYLCTVGHTATSLNEPGVGADWTDVWEELPTGTDTLGAAAWVVATEYDGPELRFKVAATGAITTNQLITHSAVSGDKKLLCVYDEVTGDPYYIEAYPIKV